MVLREVIFVGMFNKIGTFVFSPKIRFYVFITSRFVKWTLNDKVELVFNRVKIHLLSFRGIGLGVYDLPVSTASL